MILHVSDFYFWVLTIPAAGFWSLFIKFVFETNATTLSQFWSSNSFEVDL